MEINKRIGESLECSVSGEPYYSYIPKPLPPEPALQMQTLYPLLDRANLAIGQLESMGRILPDHHLSLYMMIRKEAVLSSQIEGTQSTLADLLLYESDKIPDVPEHDVIEVSNYVAAMEYGLQRLDDGFPLCLRLIREIHGILLSQGRGSHKQPGEFRQSQNWIGGTRPGNARFIPPPPEKLAELLGELETFIHDDKWPVLIKIALVHLQFETIHPFLDGNGRLGRLLITLILCVERMMSKPLLYLSVYFKAHRQLYYDHLQQVRETGDWESWLQFFLEGVIATAEQAITLVQQIERLFKDDRHQIIQLGKSSASVMNVYHYLQQHPIVDSQSIVTHCEMTLPTAVKSLNLLESISIVKEITGKARRKVYRYQAYLSLLEETGSN